jgi:hypothetical protein
MGKSRTPTLRSGRTDLKIGHYKRSEEQGLIQEWAPTKKERRPQPFGKLRVKRPTLEWRRRGV